MMNINDEKLSTIYHEVEYLIQHLCDLRYTMKNTLDDIRQIKDRLDDMICDSKNENNKGGELSECSK